MTGTAIKQGFKRRVRSGRHQLTVRHRRPVERFRRQRGVDVPMTRCSDAEGRESQGQTLEDVLASAWEDLAAGSRTECPVCGGEMVGGPAPGPTAGAGEVQALPVLAAAAPAGGHCVDCLSELF